MTSLASACPRASRWREWMPNRKRGTRSEVQLEPRLIETERLKMRVLDAGQGPAVLLLHGFPESWYSWRHQIEALVGSGYRAIAPDQRGYGQTDAPDEIAAYDLIELCADAVALLDALGIDRAAIVGHDWGAPVAWHTCLLHPRRVTAVVAMSVPYAGRPPRPPTEIFERRFGDNFFYMLYFQEPGVAEAELEANVRESLRTILYASSGELEAGRGFRFKPNTAKFLETLWCPEGLPRWLTEADLDYYTAQFEKAGFRGPINWYRNFERTWQRTEQLADAKVEHPALFIAGDRDPVIAFSRSAFEKMPRYVPDLRDRILLPETGHWTQQERPRQVNDALLGFLRELSGGL